MAVGAAVVLGGLASAIAADLPDLLSRMNDSRVQVKQDAFLEATRLNLDVRSSPYYQQLLRAVKEGMRDERPTIRNLACGVVGSIMPEPGDILREMMEMAQDTAMPLPEDRMQRAMAVQTRVCPIVMMRSMRLATRDVVSFLVDRLKDPEAEVRNISAMTLGDMKPPATDALDALKAVAAQDSDARVRQEAAQAIARIEAAPRR
jgi:hypothetical protein